MSISSETASSNCIVVATGVIDGVPIPVPVPDPDACENGVKCPVKPGDNEQYSSQIYLENDFPVVSISRAINYSGVIRPVSVFQANLTYKMELKDERFNDIVCAEVNVQLVSL